MTATVEPYTRIEAAYVLILWGTALCLLFVVAAAIGDVLLPWIERRLAARHLRNMRGDLDQLRRLADNARASEPARLPRAQAAGPSAGPAAPFPPLFSTVADTGPADPLGVPPRTLPGRSGVTAGRDGRGRHPGQRNTTDRSPA